MRNVSVARCVTNYMGLEEKEANNVVAGVVGRRGMLGVWVAWVGDRRAWWLGMVCKRRGALALLGRRVAVRDMVCVGSAGGRGCDGWRVAWARRIGHVFNGDVVVGARARQRIICHSRAIMRCDGVGRVV